MAEKALVVEDLAERLRPLARTAAFVVGVFEGDVRNIKLTYDFELETLRAMMNELPKEEAAACAPESDTTFTA